MGLNVYLSAERLRRFSNSPDVSLGLYDRWLRCQTQVRIVNPRFWGRLREQFTEIVKEAPGFAPAYGGLADLNNMQHIAHPGVFRTAESESGGFGLCPRSRPVGSIRYARPSLPCVVAQHDEAV